MLRLALALLATAALTLSACGGEDTENSEYVEQVRQVTAQLVQSASSLRPEGGSPKQIAANLDRVSDRYEQAAEDLGEIEPPEEVAALHEQLVSQLTTLQDQTANAANQVRAGGAASAVGAIGRLRKDAERTGAQVEATITQINAELQD